MCINWKNEPISDFLGRMEIQKKGESCIFDKNQTTLKCESKNLKNEAIFLIYFGCINWENEPISELFWQMEIQKNGSKLHI